MIGFVLTLALDLLIGTNLSSLEVLEGLILKIPRAITFLFVTTFDSEVEGTEFEVTGFDKADSPTLGRTEDFGKRVTEYSLGLEEEGGFPKIDCFEN